MKDKIKVGILFGGQSAEHEVSCRSAEFVYRSIDRERFEPFLIGIDKEGRYHYLKGHEDSLLNCTWTEYVEDDRVCFSQGDQAFFMETGGEKVFLDVAFPVLHGPNGEDGKLQGLFEFTGLPYVGCNTISSAICMDKDMTKKLMAAEGISQVPYFCLYEEDENSDEDVATRASDIGYPVFVKPCNMGSSVGVSKVEGEEELFEAIAEAFKYDDKVLVEKGLDVLELEVAAFGKRNDFKLSTVGAIRPNETFYDYETKYLTNDAEFDIPAPLSKKEEEELRGMAKKAFRAAMCYGLSRIDFLMDRKDRKIYFNEINTLPGFTAISLYPKLMEFDGMGPMQLISGLIDLALERGGRL